MYGLNANKIGWWGSGGGGSDSITGGGAAGYITQFTGATTIGNSPIFNNGGNIGIGTVGATAKLHVDGTFRLVDGSQGAGYVLTSDATGLTSWQPGTGSVTVELSPVISQTNTPAVGPTTGDRYLVGTVPTGVWVGHANEIAEWDGLDWAYTVPVTDNVVYITTGGTWKRYNGTSWVSYPGTAILQNGNTLGTNMIVGTKDNKDFIFITNNGFVGRFRANGNFNVGALSYFGSTTTTPSATVHSHGAGATSATYSFKAENSSSTVGLALRDDLQVEMNGFTIRQLGITTYFKTSGTGGYLWNNFSDSLNLMALTNSGNLTISNTTVVPQNAGARLSVVSPSTADGTKEYVAEFYKYTANRAGLTMAAKEGTVYLQAYTGNVAQDVNMIFGAFSSAFGVQLETLTLYADRTAKFADALYIGTEGLISFSGGTTALNFLSTLANSNIQTTVSGTGKINFVTAAGTVFHIDDDGSVYNLGAGAVVTNTAFGIDALIANTTGDNCTAFGVNTLKANTTGPQNVAIGTSAMAANTTGGYCVAIGYNALSTNNADENLAIGRIALTANTSGTFNVAIGNGTLFTNTTGNNNTGIGKSSFSLNTTGSNGVAIGYNAGSANTTGDFNTYIGVASGLTATTGSNNVFIGYGTAIGLTTGTQNTFVGSAINVGNVSNNIILSDGAGTVRFRFDNAGALTLTGPAVSAAVATASTDKIKVNVGGTDYYLLATTVA